MNFREIDFEKEITEQDIIDTIIQNNKIAVAMRSEIKKIEQANEKYQLNERKISNEKHEILDNNDSEEVETNDFEDEVDYYFSLINSIYIDNKLKEKMSEVLPSKKNVNYKRLIIRLKMELLKNIKEIEELLEEEKDELTKSDLEEFKNEVIINSKKMKIIDNLNSEKTEIEEEVEENNLFFATTSSGNIRVLEEIEAIPQEYYAGFVGLFNSIKDGTFKNVKRFTNNNRISGICEVKDYKIRVIFDRIGENDYAVISAFVKKTDKDKGYLDALYLKTEKYLYQKEEIKKNLDNKEYRELNKTYEKELFNRLENQAIDKNTFRKG